LKEKNCLALALFIGIWFKRKL